MRFGRTCPDLPADLFFDPDEWHAAYLLNKKKPPADPPTLNQVLRLVAMICIQRSTLFFTNMDRLKH
jgi:hypothetical protein